MFSSTGTRSDSGIGRPWLHTFRPTQVCVVASAAVEIDAERPLRREALDHADVVDRGRRRIGLAIAGGERVAVAREQRARLGRLVRLRAAPRRASSVQVRTMLGDRLLPASARSGSGVSPSERPMMKCTRTSGPSGKNG